MGCCGGGGDDGDSQPKQVDPEVEEKNWGEKKKFDPNFKGPMKNRSCTDVICCLIFVVCIAGLVVCSIIGFTRGNPIRLVYPTDTYGNVCGEGDYAEKEYLMFFDLLKCASMGASVVTYGCPTPQICVSECPTAYWSYVETVAKELTAGAQLSAERDKMICKYSVDQQSAAKTVNEYVEDEDCAAYYVKTTSVINRCIPSIFMDIANWAADLTYDDGSGTSRTITAADGDGVTATELDDASYYLALFYEVKEFVELLYKDVVASWWMLLVGFGIATALCMIWIVLMRWVAGPMVWITIVLIFALLGFACYYSFTEYNELKDLNATAEYAISHRFADNFSYYTSLKETWLAFAIISAVIIGILLLLFLFLVKRICIAIEVIKEASRAVGNMFSTLFWPIIPFLLQIAVFGYWAVAAVYVASMGDKEYYSNSTNTSSNGVDYYLKRVPCDPDTSVSSTLGSVCDFVKYGGDEYIIPMQVFMLFMLLWLLNFIVALGQMTLAGAFASYYWAWEKPKDIPAFPLSASLYRSLRYHTGSLAFGSFIIAVVQMIRIFLEYLEYKLKDSENRVAKFIIKCLQCCFWCLEKFLKFLNKNAYILTAIYGKNFCIAAKDAFFLIMRNIVRVVVLDKVTDFLLFLSKALITGAVCVMSFFWFKGSIDYFDGYVVRPELNYYLTPVIILTLCTYLITCAFFSVYSMAVDTMFLCFLEDLEMHDGTAEKPYFMSKGMMKILGKKNKFEDPRKGGNKNKGANKIDQAPEKGRELPEPPSKKKGKWA